MQIFQVIKIALMSNQKTVCISLFQIYLLSERTIYIESRKRDSNFTFFLPPCRCILFGIREILNFERNVKLMIMDACFY